MRVLIDAGGGLLCIAAGAGTATYICWRRFVVIPHKITQRLLSAERANSLREIKRIQEEIGQR